VPPLHVEARPFGVETIMPGGRASSITTKVFETAALELVITNVSEVVPLTGIDATPKALVMGRR
jgi:hypothetical protein